MYVIVVILSATYIPNLTDGMLVCTYIHTYIHTYIVIMVITLVQHSTCVIDLCVVQLTTLRPIPTSL